MALTQPPATRKLTVVAKDPGLRLGKPDGPIALTRIDVPAEILAPGPTGYRIKVVDYNAAEQRAYRNNQVYQGPDGELFDPFAPRQGEDILDPAYQARIIADPNFHAQNAYAIAMRTLGHFEHALGRRVSWSSGGHQLHIAPHAFAQANAFYSESDRALMFGYFRGRKGDWVFTSLSHDIVAHETTHALLDGLLSRYTEPSGPDQAAFHEGFADIVALLSLFTLQPVVAAAIGEDGQLAQGTMKISLVKASKLHPKAIEASILTGIAEQVGNELNGGQRKALRRSVELTPEMAAGLTEPHDRGEILVAAIMKAFIYLWCGRIESLGRFKGGTYNLGLVVEEGAKLAGHLLTMCIRALDYCPPVDIDFGQYLAALLTADQELLPDDEPFHYRKILRDSFARFGIEPPKDRCNPETGTWHPFEDDGSLVYARSHYDAMTRDRDEFFHFLWENQKSFNISEHGYTEVVSIRAASRVSPDGLAVKETICQYIQIAHIFGAECESVLGFEHPADIRTTERLEAFGGGVVILDQYGRVKFHIANSLKDGPRQLARLRYLIDSGEIDAGARQKLQFGLIHQKRMGG